MNTEYWIKKQAVYTKHRQIMKHCQMCRNAFLIKVSCHDGQRESDVGRAAFMIENSDHRDVETSIRYLLYFNRSLKTLL
jgi:hypothetical protein